MFTVNYNFVQFFVSPIQTTAEDDCWRECLSEKKILSIKSTKKIIKNIKSPQKQKMTSRILHICRIFLQAILLVIFFLFFGLPAIQRFQAREVRILELIKLLCGSFISQDCLGDVGAHKQGNKWHPSSHYLSLPIQQEQLIIQIYVN